MIHEVVITSGKKNKAPIGIYLKEKKIIIHLFEGSHTYQNLMDDDYFVANICHPIEIAEAVLTDEDDYGYLNFDGKDLSYLKNAYKIFVAKVNKRKFITKRDNFGESKLMIVEGEIVFEKELKNTIIPYNRADGLLVEMAVIYSRLNNEKIVMKNEDREAMKKDMEKYFKIIKKVGSKRHVDLAKRFMSLSLF
ncbi:DUF447 domain-containing protein [Methanotorris formicicus]|uniref:DUF447 family protein n=1 Tax=Methanotorris formicicus Mc-S-70 TaxID=647171 RepID=H1KZ20_9EURY|nr:DUF447 domain-containing protein [Methanotorris formicicus]EHP86445.1 protein of unknown function DUF447 [Methanotorris formicicus Mc-S-70]